MTATPFSRTYMRLLSDRGWSGTWTLAGAIGMLGAWGWWSVHGQVTLREVSSEARVELDLASHPVQSPLLGRVVSARMQVGQSVRAGDVLVEIDAMPDRLQWQEQRVRAESLGPELGRLHAQLAAEEAARTEERQTARLSADEAANRIGEAETAARYVESELARMQDLARERLVAARDLEKAEGEAKRMRAAVATLKSAALRVPQEQATRDRERDARIEKLNSEIAGLEGRRNTLRAGMNRLGYEIDQRRVRAPVDGRIGEAAILRAGAVVQPGERLASIVPAGGLLVAAQFPAEAAFGRIRVGQPAVLRLNAFPWAEFGAVSATVARVAEEVREGKVRVELSILSTPGFRGRLEHGMPGALEVLVERLTPLSLALRTAGQSLTSRP
ncbi:MAG TPA: HlyD family efflux transporter periplasmic adaptor subunit [Bryobacteraceae bacterium]|jgi:membrane fusion protein (multidrug efflux system)|nr:HlyD family efflux transporter periplasmic adaptor subunit [Bryobacteraceae bacterium]